MLTLQSPSRDLFEPFLRMAADYASAGEARYQRPGGWNLSDFNGYLQHLDEQSKGVNLDPSRSPQTTFWLVEDNSRIVGVARIRTILTENLKKEGGNIGYDVPPSQRRKGYGTELLRQAIVRATELGLAHLLITCDKDNVASRKMIERNGGLRESEDVSEESGKAVLRYRIR